jgi:multidrug efflux pump subunit AcrA (membrane-fusion protein)
VAAPVSGIVARMLRQPGDWVRQGDPVIQLDESLLRITLSNAQAAVETARINLSSVQDSTSQSLPRLQFQVQSAQSARDSAKRSYDSQKALFDLGGISASALDLSSSQLAGAEAALESAKLALDQGQRGFATTASQNVDVLKIALVTAQNNAQLAQYNLDNAVIKAPFAGQIMSVTAMPGIFIGQNATAFQLVSVERQLSFNISPADAKAVRQGMVLSFEVEGRSWPIRVKVTPSNPVNSVIPLTATFPQGLDLPYGSVGNVSYLVDLAQGTILSLTSLATIENQNFVYLLVDGKVQIQNVSILAESGILAAVTGVEAGAAVIVSPPPGLIAGLAVQPRMVPMPVTTNYRPLGAAPGAKAASTEVTGQSGRQRGGQGSGQGGSQYSGQRSGQQGALGGGTGTSALPAPASAPTSAASGSTAP